MYYCSFVLLYSDVHEKHMSFICLSIQLCPLNVLLLCCPVMFWCAQMNGTTYVILTYGVATISRLLKIIGLFCKRAL